MPPRHGKSEFVSRYFPAWYLGRFPDKRIILTSYEAGFASGWGRKARAVLTEFGPEVFGVRVSQASRAGDDWGIEGREGGMVTAGVGGPITGRGADVLIIDDPVKNAEEARSPTIREKVWDWFESTASTRLEPGGSIVLIMTRWHLDDLAGRVVAGQGEFGREPWTVVNLPALARDNDPIGRAVGEPLWPERYDLKALEPHQADPYWWSALYQQDPTAEGGVEWPPEYFDHAAFWFDQWPERLAVKAVFLDPSKGNKDKAGDYAAEVRYGRDGDGIEYVEADLRRIDADAIVARGVETLRTFNPDAYGIEDNAFQHLFAPLFKSAAAKARVGLPLYLIHNTTPKVVRIRRLTEPLQRRIIRFRNTPGTRLLVQQLREFPLGIHDDGPDALEGARRLAIKLTNAKPMRRRAG